MLNLKMIKIARTTKTIGDDLWVSILPTMLILPGYSFTLATSQLLDEGFPNWGAPPAVREAYPRG